MIESGSGTIDRRLGCGIVIVFSSWLGKLSSFSFFVVAITDLSISASFVLSRRAMRVASMHFVSCSSIIFRSICQVVEIVEPLVSECRCREFLIETLDVVVAFSKHQIRWRWWFYFNSELMFHPSSMFFSKNNNQKPNNKFFFRRIFASITKCDVTCPSVTSRLFNRSCQPSR